MLIDFAEKNLFFSAGSLYLFILFKRSICFQIVRKQAEQICGNKKKYQKKKIHPEKILINDKAKEHKVRT